MKRPWLFAAVTLGLTSACSAEEPAQAQSRSKLASATFAGGCFWCTESDFDKIPGVVSTTSGYIGGKLANPTYKQVSSGGTGHIEAVRVLYDPTKVSYATLVNRFFRTIDPLDSGGQFCDRGYQYRSAIFVSDAGQRRIADATKKAVAGKLARPVATLVLPASKFYPAEDYHQNYYKKNPLRYRFYRSSCGRDSRIAEVWKTAGR